MSDAIPLLLAGGIPTILGLFGGWLLHRRRHLREVDKLLALHKRQFGVSAARLAEANRRTDSLKQEVLLLKKEFVQQQARRLRAEQRASMTIDAAPVRGVTEPARQERTDDATGFADTQPWQHGSR
jgi:hypothetical protein